MKTTILFFVFTALALGGITWWAPATTDHPVANERQPLTCRQVPPAIPLAAEAPILQSRDDGASWEPLPHSLPDGIMVRQLISHEDALVAVTFRHGLWRKQNEYAEWKRVAGREVEGIVVTAAYHNNQLWVSTDGTGLSVEFAPGMWLRMQKPPGSSPVRCLYSGQGYVLAGTDTGLYRRTDSGGQWEKVFGDEQVNDFAGHASTLVAATRTGLAVSTDAGESWELEQGPTTFFRVNHGRGIFTAQGENGKSLLSADQAVSWQNCAAAGSGTRVISGDRNRLLMSKTDGVYRSTDGGRQWEPLAVSPERVFSDFLRVGEVLYGITFNSDGC